MAGTRESLETWLGQAGFSLTSCWAMGDSLDDIARAGEADLNLVVSATGLRAARVLKERFGQPWVAGIPCGDFAGVLDRAMEQSLTDGRDRLAYLEARVSCRRDRGEAVGLVPESRTSVFVGEPVVMGSLAAALELSGEGVRTRLLAPVEDSGKLVSTELGDACAQGEEEVERALSGVMDVIADPFYQPLCDQRDQEGFAFHQLPQLALSGRQWLHEIPNLLEMGQMPLG